MANAHQIHPPTPHRSTFIPPRREAREERRAALRTLHRRRRFVAFASLGGMAGLAAVSIAAHIITR